VWPAGWSASDALSFNHRIKSLSEERSSGSGGLGPQVSRRARTRMNEAVGQRTATQIATSARAAVILGVAARAYGRFIAIAVGAVSRGSGRLPVSNF
jgi:hypothetical protein